MYSVFFKNSQILSFIINYYEIICIIAGGECSRPKAVSLPGAGRRISPQKTTEFFKSGEYSHTGEKQGTKRGFSGDKKGKDFPIKTGQFYSLAHKKVGKIDFFDKKRSKKQKNSEK